MGKGTEAFPDLGEHCEHDDCNQLDFLPFTCNGCHKVFCLEHRTYKAHSCPKSEHRSRVVVICDNCSTTIEKQHAYEEDTITLDTHKNSGDCDPTKKEDKKPKCPIARCKQLLTFSNTSICKKCNLKVCLKHRFPSDHDCKHNSILLLTAKRSGMDCRNAKQKISASSVPVKAC